MIAAAKRIGELTLWIAVIALLAYMMAERYANADECEKPLPLVCEVYDGIAAVSVQESGYSTHMIYFCRAGKIIAERCPSDDMRITQDSGAWFLQWRDYHHVPCERIIRFTWFVEIEVVGDCAENLSWWDARRVATELQAP